jgi:Icc-related predicted phosphoesterase
MFYVHGNHANRTEHSLIGSKKAPEGGQNINQKVIEWNGIILAGIEGCLQYNYGPYQYTQMEMWVKVLALVPGLILNKIRTGRYLDVFITHAPAWGIHDQPDRPHQGIKAFTWLIKTFQPSYHVHGHIHVYRNDIETSTWVGKTLVVNSYGYKEIVMSPGRSRSTSDMVQ